MMIPSDRIILIYGIIIDEKKKHYSTKEKSSNIQDVC